MKNMNEIEQIDITKLKPYPDNAKKHIASQIDAIAKSIKEFGFVGVVIVDETNTILAGHGRVAGAKKAGLTTVPCLKYTNLTDKQKRLFVIADNRLAEVGGGWDEKILEKEIQDILKNTDYDIGEFGFDEQFVYDIISKNLEENSEVSDEMAEKFPQMELQAFESYDYIVLFFKDSRDFLNVAQRIGVKRVLMNRPEDKTKKVGIGRLIRGEKIIELLK
jgi:ParB-like chromosome segregation protein Spo0J